MPEPLSQNIISFSPGYRVEELISHGIDADGVENRITRRGSINQNGHSHMLESMFANVPEKVQNKGAKFTTAKVCSKGTSEHVSGHRRRYLLYRSTSSIEIQERECCAVLHYLLFLQPFPSIFPYRLKAGLQRITQTAMPGACSKQGPANVPLGAGYPSGRPLEEQTTSSLEAHSSYRDVPGA